MDGAAVAMLLAVAIFVTVRAWWRRWTLRPLDGGAKIGNPSPGWGVIVWRWISAHIHREPEPEPEPDPPILTQDFEWGSVDYTESHGRRETVRQALPRRRPVVPPAKPSGPPARPGPQPPTRLDEWVAASLGNGALYRDVLREGRRLFGVSESTVKRSIRRARREGTP